MTLIISFTVDKFPFILGDLLISKPQEAYPPLHIPTVGDVPTNVNDRYTPTGLCRKVCHFGNVTIAWAGLYDEAKEIILQIYKKTIDHGQISIEQLGDIFANLSADLMNAIAIGKISLLGYIINPDDGKVINFSRGKFKEVNFTFIKDVKIAGSGTDVIFEYFEHQTLFDLIGAEKVGSFEEALCRALIFNGMLLEIEMRTQKTLKSSFGGGYELIALRDNQIILMDDIMLAFWYADIKDGKIKLNPVMKLFKQSYERDILIIDAIELKVPDQKYPLLLNIWSNEIHYVGPIYNQPTRKEFLALARPDLKACMLCTYIFIQNQNSTNVSTLFFPSKNRELPIQLVNDGGSVVIQLQKKYVDDIYNAIMYEN